MRCARAPARRFSERGAVVRLSGLECPTPSARTLAQPSPQLPGPAGASPPRANPPPSQPRSCGLVGAGPATPCTAQHRRPTVKVATPSTPSSRVGGVGTNPFRENALQASLEPKATEGLPCHPYGWQVFVSPIPWVYAPKTDCTAIQERVYNCCAPLCAPLRGGPCACSRLHDHPRHSACPPPDVTGR